MLLSPFGQQTKQHFRFFKFQHLYDLVVIESANEYCYQVERLKVQVYILTNLCSEFKYLNTPAGRFSTSPLITCISSGDKVPSEGAVR